MKTVTLNNQEIINIVLGYQEHGLFSNTAVHYSINLGYKLISNLKSLDSLYHTLLCEKIAISQKYNIYETEDQEYEPSVLASYQNELHAWQGTTQSININPINLNEIPEDFDMTAFPYIYFMIDNE